MILRDLKNIALVGSLAMLSACTVNGGGDDADDDTGNATDNATTGNPTTTTPTTGGDTDAGEDGAICKNFGGYDGVKGVIGSFVGKVLADERINAYFLNTESIGDGGARLTECLNKQVGEAVGCSGIVYDCMDMASTHAGMGISMNDFNDLAEDFSMAMDEVATLTVEDKMTVLGVLGGMAPMIVEDEANNATTYQIIGRKPGVNAVIGGPDDPDSLVGLVAADTTLIGFFAKSDLARLKTCLVRQVTDATAGGSILGNIYGTEVTSPVPSADPGVTTETPCRDMKSSHVDLKDTTGDMMGIQFADFLALVAHLETAMNKKGVGMTEQNAIKGALAPMCPDIVTVDPELCG